MSVDFDTTALDMCVLLADGESIAGSLVDDEAIFGYCQNNVWHKMNLATLRALVGGAGGGGLLALTKQAVYEHRDIWAEERVGPTTTTPRWSFGDGANGYAGLVVDTGWEVEALYFQADLFAANARITVDLMNYGLSQSTAPVGTLASIALTSATDGGGQTNNAFKYAKLVTPVLVPVNAAGSTFIGFHTRSFTGSMSNMRVGARLRRKIGDFVVNAALT